MIITLIPKNLKNEQGNVKDLHITLFFLGKSEEVSQKEETRLIHLLKDYKPKITNLTATITGVSRFQNVRKMVNENNEIVDATSPTDAVYAEIDSNDILTFREKLSQYLDENNVEYSKLHSFKPHMTLSYVPNGQEYVDETFNNTKLDFHSFWLKSERNGKKENYWFPF